jgi:outer membrane immunogenic protein
VKRILSGLVVAAARSGSALAADLPLPTYTKAPATKAPAIPAPAYNWSGWYGGLNAGWVGGAGSVSNNASIVSNDIPEVAEAMARGATNTAGASSGFIGGGQFGYNYQFSHLFVAGFEADIQGLTGAHKGSSSAVGTVLVPNPVSNAPTHIASVVTNSTNSHGLSYLGTLRARIGVLVAPSFLLYATGGLAYGGARSDTTIVQSIDDPPLATLKTSGSFSKTRVGYAVGAGGEWMLSSNWSAKLEYLVLRFGLRNLRYRRSRKRHWSGAKPWYRHRCGCCRYFFAGPLQRQHRSRRRELPFQQPGGFAILIGKARL